MTAISTTTDPSDHLTLLRLKQVLKIVPVSKTTWWDGVKAGRFPKPIKLGPRTTCWRAADIFALMAKLSNA